MINTDDRTGKDILGTVKFPLDRIERQEEYDLELEIPDENDENLIMAKINAKIQFIWSVYKYYQDLSTKNERTLQNCANMLQKTTSLLENLNEPFKFVEFVGNKNENSWNVEESTPNKIQYKTSAGHQDHTQQYEVADKLENFIKTSFSKNS